ncbi:MAG: hypothetical protein ABIS45_03720 [Burkholderiales bacterium]
MIKAKHSKPPIADKIKNKIDVFLSAYPPGVNPVRGLPYRARLADLHRRSSAFIGGSKKLWT